MVEIDDLTPQVTIRMNLEDIQDFLAMHNREGLEKYLGECVLRELETMGKFEDKEE